MLNLVRCFLISCLVSCSSTLLAAEEYPEMKWETLMPETTGVKTPLEQAMPMHYIANMNEDLLPTEIAIKLKKMQPSGSVRDDLNGKLVKIAGFTVPLQSNEEGDLTEFFLVPFVGACIHVPPPPTNQIIHVIYPEGYKLKMLSQPIWVYGKLKTQNTQSEIADAGYEISAENIEDYSGWY